MDRIAKEERKEAICAIPYSDCDQGTSAWLKVSLEQV